MHVHRIDAFDDFCLFGIDDEVSVLQEEVQRVFFRYLDVIHLVEKGFLVKLLKAEDFAAGLF